LAVLWGGTPITTRAEGRLDWWTIDLTVDTLLNLINANPAIASLESQLEARQAEVRLARSLGKPDITLGGGYRRLHDHRDNALLVWASLPLPLFDRNEGGVSEATAQGERLEAELTATKQRLTAELRQRVVTLTVQLAEVTILQEDVLPPAEEALEAIDEAFRLGSQPFINVLDAQRTLTDIQLRLVDAQVAGAQTAAEIESLIGRPINAARR
jgi:cobalt-zinc-cadmium efflux system outer membrane protein